MIKQIFFTSHDLAVRLEPRSNWCLIFIDSPPKNLFSKKNRRLKPSQKNKKNSYRFKKYAPKTDPREKDALQGKWKEILTLEFNDIEKPLPQYVLFSDIHANIIIDFLEKVSVLKTVDTLIVSCLLGRSRSAAVAMFAQDKYGQVTRNLLGTQEHNSIVKCKLDRQFDLRFSL